MLQQFARQDKPGETPLSEPSFNTSSKGATELSCWRDPVFRLQTLFKIFIRGTISEVFFCCLVFSFLATSAFFNVF